MRWLFWKKKEVEPCRKPEAPRAGKRMFQAGLAERITSPWVVSNANINDLLITHLQTMKLRSQEQYWNHGYAKQAVRLYRKNVIGADGIRLQCRFRKKGVILTSINQEIEEKFAAWGEASECDVAGESSWIDFQQQAIVYLVRDGEAIFRLIEGANNKTKFALQAVDPELLDVNVNRIRTQQHTKIVMGVEVDEWEKPIAYYFKRDTDSFQDSGHTRIPAKEIIHLFVKEKIGQRRGIPWLHSSVRQLHMLQGYSDAELTAARVSAAKMGFFTTDGKGGQYKGDDVDDAGNMITDAQPGSFETLPAGVDIKQWDPQHPQSNFGTFTKSMLRCVAAGVGVSYTSLASDMESVNFSSIRSSLLDERDEYKTVQNMVVEHLCLPVYRAWLRMAALTGRISVPFTDIDNYMTPTFLPKRWSWVDPEKDVDANIKSINAKLKSRTEICAEQGRDFDDIVAELAQEKIIAEEHGIDLEEIVPNGSQGIASQSQGDSVPIN